MNVPPLALYVHLPWCVKKCPYCDFNSHTAGTTPPKADYIKALLHDLALEATRVEGRQLSSIFLGGGTPSLFTADEVSQILDGIRHCFACQDDLEVTMEANPGTVESAAPAGYRKAGVNRLSIGAQSFSDESLKTLGRIHKSADIERAVKSAQDGGFDNINLDLMHCLPGQTVETACHDIASALALGPQHLSWYQLTLEPNTVFHARPPKNLPGEEQVADIQDAGRAMLNDAGFLQYEISAYATVDKRCRHNVNYWEFGDYVAVGAGAHGKLTIDGAIGRYQKIANPTGYRLAMREADRPLKLVHLDQDDTVFEFMLNASRLTEGFPEALFCNRTGLKASQLSAAAAKAREKGLLEVSKDHHWRPTTLGSRFLNDLQAEFLPGS